MYLPVRDPSQLTCSEKRSIAHTENTSRESLDRDAVPKAHRVGEMLVDNTFSSSRPEHFGYRRTVEWVCKEIIKRKIKSGNGSFSYRIMNSGAFLLILAPCVGTTSSFHYLPTKKKKFAEINTSRWSVSIKLWETTEISNIYLMIFFHELHNIRLILCKIKSRVYDEMFSPLNRWKYQLYRSFLNSRYLSCDRNLNQTAVSKNY